MKYSEWEDEVAQLVREQLCAEIDEVVSIEMSEFRRVMKGAYRAEVAPEDFFEEHLARGPEADWNREVDEILEG